MAISGPVKAEWFKNAQYEIKYFNAFNGKVYCDTLEGQETDRTSTKINSRKDNLGGQITKKKHGTVEYVVDRSQVIADCYNYFLKEYY